MTRDRTERRVALLKNVEGESAQKILECRLCGEKVTSRNGTFERCKCDQTKYELPYMVTSVEDNKDGSTTTNKYVIARDTRNGTVRVLEQNL